MPYEYANVHWQGRCCFSSSSHGIPSHCVFFADTHIFDAAPVVISKQDQRVVAHSYVDRDIDIAGCYGCGMTDGILDYRL